MEYKAEDQDPLPATDGFFFLQRTGQKAYLARCKFEAGDVNHYEIDGDDTPYENEKEVHINGRNLSAIVLKGW